MSDNDMYPADGSYYLPTEPEEQVKERRESLSKAQAAKPMLEDLLAIYESDITQLKSVDSIPEAAQLDPDEFRIAWAINQEILSYARDKKLYLESLLSTLRR